VRALASSLIVAGLLLAGSAPAQPAAEPLEAQLKRARAEQAVAEAATARLQRDANRAQGELARIRAQQAAAAQAIEAAEARITAADMELRLASAYLDLRRRRLAEERRPVASLLAGLAVMAQRPPLLAIAERGSTDEFVKVRVLLDSTLPLIRKRTAALSTELREGEQLEQAAAAARAQRIQGRQDLVARRRQFAALERQAMLSAARASGEALSAGDTALAAAESVEQLASGQAGSREAAALAAALAAADPAPARPIPADSAPPAAPLNYRLPAEAPVVEGLGSVNSSGIRSRGITLATRRGTAVTAPAAGTVRFSRPFRSYDGVTIIDHGGGWVSLLVNVASPLKAGARVRLGDAVGRTLGPLVVELSQNGRRISPALIAGSSQTLSKGGKRG
jgi:murein hydrolase activator